MVSSAPPELDKRIRQLEDKLRKHQDTQEECARLKVENERVKQELEKTKQELRLLKVPPREGSRCGVCGMTVSKSGSPRVPPVASVSSAGLPTVPSVALPARATRAQSVVEEKDTSPRKKQLPVAPPSDDEDDAKAAAAAVTAPQPAQRQGYLAAELNPAEIKKQVVTRYGGAMDLRGTRRTDLPPEPEESDESDDSDAPEPPPKPGRQSFTSLPDAIEIPAAAATASAAPSATTAATTVTSVSRGSNTMVRPVFVVCSCVFFFVITQSYPLYDMLCDFVRFFLYENVPGPFCSFSDSLLMRASQGAQVAAVHVGSRQGLDSLGVAGGEPRVAGQRHQQQRQRLAGRQGAARLGGAAGRRRRRRRRKRGHEQRECAGSGDAGQPQG